MAAPPPATRKDAAAGHKSRPYRAALAGCLGTASRALPAFWRAGELRCLLLFLIFSQAGSPNRLHPQRKLLVILEASFPAAMCKSQLVMARGHVVNTAKNALELSHKPVILITGRNVTLGKRA